MYLNLYDYQSKASRYRKGLTYLKNRANTKHTIDSQNLQRREHKHKIEAKVKLLSRVQLFATPWTATQAPPSMEFSRQEYWSGLPFPSPGDLPNSGIEPRFPTLQADTLPSEPKRKSLNHKKEKKGTKKKQKINQENKV